MIVMIEEEFPCNGGLHKLEEELVLKILMETSTLTALNTFLSTVTLLYTGVTRWCMAYENSFQFVTLHIAQHQKSPVASHSGAMGIILN